VGGTSGDDGKQHTKRFRTEAEAEQSANKERGKVNTNQWVSPTVGGDTFRSVAEQWILTKASGIWLLCWVSRKSIGWSSGFRPAVS
jgi:hypothetical protein